MESRTVSGFWKRYDRLPENVKKAASKQYALWLKDPNHSSLRFKKVGCYWSARVTGSYRAVGVMDENTIVWFFIGTHREYERILA